VTFSSSPDAIVTVVEPPPSTMMRNSAPVPRRDVTEYPGPIAAARASIGPASFLKLATCLKLYG